MLHTLKANQFLRGESNGTYKIESLIGIGGQGEVYVASSAGERVALKWYLPNFATAKQRKAIEKLVERGAPDNRFLWPLEIVHSQETSGFGYVMPLRDSHYKGLNDMIKLKVNPTDRVTATACLELAQAYWTLHSEGLCYRDISLGNVFFNPQTGKILICDNDNVTFDKDPIVTILGTPRFMAPEIVLGKAKPSSDTDRFSLAVLLFFLLFVSHPLDGQNEFDIRCTNYAAMEKLYGKNPIFIFDPENDSNRPVEGYHENPIALWPLYPKSTQKLFVKSFTTGLRDPTNRVGETKWIPEMINLRDSIFLCNCEAENFFDPNAEIGKNCWNCCKPLDLPKRLEYGRRGGSQQSVVLEIGTELFPHHLSGKREDFSTPLARVVVNPKNPNLFGLENMGKEAWTLTSVDGKEKQIAPGRKAALKNGAQINFDPIVGKVIIERT